MEIVVVMPVEEEHKALLRSVAPEGNVIFCTAKEVDDELLQNAEIIVGNLPPDRLKVCENLKLLQLNTAGTDGYTAPGILPDGAVLTNATGSYGVGIAEHMVGSLLLLMKKLDLYRLNQEQALWKDEGSVKSIYGSKTLVVGLGDIGSEFAIRMKAMGSSVTGIRRQNTEKPDYVDALFQMERLYECLSEADIVAASLPNTKETVKIFDEKAFGSMKKGSYFINVGRGNAVDQDALFDALSSGHLAGAAIDVTDPEPLPSDSKLWNAPNIFITPHVSGGFHLKETHDRIVRIAAENIKHLINDEPLISVVDMETGYRKL